MGATGGEATEGAIGLTTLRPSRRISQPFDSQRLSLESAQGLILYGITVYTPDGRGIFKEPQTWMSLSEVDVSSVINLHEKDR